MNTVKRWLAGFLSFAMIFTSASFLQLGALNVFAQKTDYLEAAASEKTAATVTLTGKTGVVYETITLDGSTNTEFQDALNHAKAGDTISVDGTVILNSNVYVGFDVKDTPDTGYETLETGVYGKLKLTDKDDKITLDLTKATIRTAAGHRYTINPGNDDKTKSIYGYVSEFKESNNVWVYSAVYYGNENLVVNFPSSYSAANNHGVQVSFSQASGEARQLTQTRAYEDAAFVYKSGTGWFVDKNGNGEYNSSVDETISSAPALGTNYYIAFKKDGVEPTCITGGDLKLVADVLYFDGKSSVNAVANKVFTNPYGAVEALGHNYGTPDDDGIITLTPYTTASTRGTEAIWIDWAIRGNGSNVIRSVDDDGNTVIEGIVTKCQNNDAHGVGAEAPDYVDAKSWKIVKAEAATKATSSTAGTTIYTIEIVTGDDATIRVQQTVSDIAGIEATEVGAIQSMKFKAYTYKYDAVSKSFSQVGSAIYLNGIYVDYTAQADLEDTNYGISASQTNDKAVVTAIADATFARSAIAEDGSLDYQIKYTDARNSKTGTINGTMEAVDKDGNHKTIINECGVNTYYWKPIKVNQVTAYATGSTQNIYLGAVSDTVTSIALVPQNPNPATFESDYIINESNAKYFSATAVNTNSIDLTSNTYTGGKGYLYHQHTVDMNNGNYKVDTPATTYSTGLATITCKHCGIQIKGVEVPALTSGVRYEKTDGTLTTADNVQDANKNGVYTVDATCEKEGYNFYWSADDTDSKEFGTKYAPNNLTWSQGMKATYDSSNDKYLYNSVEISKDYLDTNLTIHKHPGIEVKIAGSEKAALGHKWYIAKPSDANWHSGTSNCTVMYTCERDINAGTGTSTHAQKKVEYYAGNGDDVVTDTTADESHYNAITKTLVEGKDCTEKNKEVYTVNDITCLGNPVQTSITVQSVGPHDFTDHIDWSADGKKATVTRKCSNEKCKGDGSTGSNYNTTPLVVSATVTKADQDDGSYLYTAKLNDETVGTKKVFDLRDAKAVVNDGNAVDNNIYPGPYADANNIAAVEANKLPKYVVTINGKELDSDLYTYVAGSYSQNGKLATFQITAADDTDAYGTYTVQYTILKNKQFSGYGAFVVDEQDPIKYNDAVKIPEEIIYDGNTHKIVVTSVRGDAGAEVIKKTTVKYAVVPYVNGVSQTVKDPKKLTYTDTAEFTELGDYDVYAEFSADGYTTYYTGKLTTVSIVKEVRKAVVVYIDNASVIEGNKPNLHVRVVSAAGQDAGEEMDVDLADFNITTVGGEDINNLKVGTYKLLVSSDKYRVTMGNASGVNADYVAILTVLAKDGSTPEEQAAAESATALIKALNENSTEAEVKAARDAYDKLSDTAKARVDADTVKKLTDAEDKIATDKVIAAMNAATTDAEKAAAYEAYSKLSDAQKAAVDTAVGKDKVDAAKAAKDATDKKAAEEAAAKKAAADKAAADAVIAKLAAITDSSKQADAKEAVDAYNALTADQKKLVDANAAAKANLAKAQSKANTPDVQASKVKISTKSKTYKASKLKKKKQSFKLKYTKTGNGKVTFKKVSGSKKLTVSKAGKVTVKKGTKKGTYKIKVKISIAKTATYKAASSTKQIKVKVKK